MKTLIIALGALFILLFPVKSKRPYYFSKGRKVDLKTDPRMENIGLGDENAPRPYSGFGEGGLDPIRPAEE